MARAPGSPMAGQLSYGLSVHIPGDTLPLVLQNVNVGTVFGAIKDQVWAKKGWDEKGRPKKNYTFRVVGGEMYFADDDMFSSLVHVSGIFRDSPDRNAAPEVTLYPAADIADKQKRETLLCSQSPVLFHGYLNKLGEGMLAGWTRRYFVLQDNTLFYFADEKAWASGKEKAKGFVPMPCHFVRHNEHKGQKLVFELQAKHLGKRNYFMSAESEQSFDGWRRVCTLMSLRRAKTVTATVCEEMTTRGVSELEMVFQLPGAKDVVAKLKTAFDNGDIVRLGDVQDYKAMADVVKIALKDTLQEPMLSYALYSRWIMIPQDDQSRIAEVRSLLTHLSTPTQCFLEFFLGFMQKVAAASLTNMMTPKLLAACVGPLMMRSEDAAKQVDDYRAIETMIEHWGVVFRSAEDEKKALKPLDDTPPPPPPAAAAAAAAPAAAGDGPVGLAEAEKWRQRFQYANGNWEKDWRLRQKHVMGGLGELHTKLKSTGTALPAGLADVNACFLAEAEWRAESLTVYDDLIAKLAKLTAAVQAAGAAPPPPPPPS